MNNKFFPSNFLFILIMVMGTTMTLSSPHWLTMWIGLELNLMGFLPLMNIKGKSLEAEASMKYFIIQSMSSSILIMTSLILYNYNMSWYSMFNHKMLSTMMLLSLILKLGGAPLHFWLPNMTKQMTWLILFLILTWQKLAPLFMLTLISNLNILILISLMSTLLGSIMILNQTNMQVIITYSSISHLGWMLSMIMINNSLTFIYFINYIIISIPLMNMLNNYTNNYTYTLTHKNKINKLIIPSLILSLAGLPPLLGFLSKLLILISLMQTNFIIMTLLLFMGTLISLFFYLNMTLMIIVKSYFLFENNNMTKPYESIIMLNMFSIFVFYILINIIIKYAMTILH
uniref:NADH-ubiquinone oxidoreductase chain 2 n=1 Tax=Acanthosepion pharaonis TaxID=158019 RepID=M9UY57_ACAPH|nr:NADH dehydrogenase subunit 2 [Sepia pharaonis]AGJ71767.1 NADH dehydrogenase subunit 2 [Sepia pharaonis]